MFYYQKEGRFFAQIAGGLEELGCKELRALGATEAEPVPRGIDFQADLPTLYRINYRSHLVTRVLAPLLKFSALTPESLYLQTKKVDWTRIFGLDQTFAVQANVHRSAIDHSQFAALKVKDCVADMFRKRFRGKRPNVDTKNPDLWISVHILEDQVTVSIDCSGGSLHRRGYRLKAVEAPMQETLAAAILEIAGWDGKRRLYDPMCGSGTLLSEAWLKAGGIPAGKLRKKFGFMMLPDFDRRDWVRVKFEEDNKIQPVRGGLIRGSDIDPGAVKISRSNNAHLPGGDELLVKTSDFRDLPEMPNRIIVCNPPYGVRLQAGQDLSGLYRDLGDFLKQKCSGGEAYVYFGEKELIKSVGLHPAFRLPLRNGGLDGRLVKYEMY